MTRRLIFAGAACLPPLVVYLRTMAPGLLARGDVPKFQFLGAVLGTAHSPGYPLFVQLSWLFSQIPAGSIAWRINLMTALFGAGAAGTTAWVARRCGVSRPAALLSAWGMAFGPVFWEQATAAEVYTLAAVLQASALALVLRWSDTRRDGHLLQAIAVSALALGHHPTFAMTAPALAAFVLITDWRILTRWRVVAGGVGLLIVGLAQYGFVVLRTIQGAAYLEARADRWSDLLELLRGTQYESSLFAFSTADLISVRVPYVWHFLTTELSSAGMVLAIAGWAVLAVRAWRKACLLALAGGSVFVFAATYDVGDLHVFVIPVFLVFWVAAAAGLAQLASLAGTRAGASVATTAAVALSALAVSRSFAARDLSADTWDDTYVTAFLSQIETPATLLFDTYDPMSHAVRYKLLAERTGHRVRLGYASESSQPDVDYAGARAVYANEAARAILEARGIELARVEFEAKLTDRLADLPGDGVVALALPAGSASWLSPDDARFLEVIGVRRLPEGLAYAAILQGGKAVAEHSAQQAAARARIGGAEFGAVLSGGVARVDSGVEPAESRRAGILASYAADGTLLWAEELDRSAGIRPTFEQSRRTFFRAVGAAPCKAASVPIPAVWAAGPLGTRLSAWLETPGHRPGRVAETTVALYATSDDQLVAFVGRSLGEDVVLEIDQSHFDRADATDARRLIDATTKDQIILPEAGRFVTRATTTFSGVEDGAAGVSALLGMVPRPETLAATVSGAGLVRFCLPPVAGLVLFGTPSEFQHELIRGESDMIGPGWRGVEQDGASRLRWTSAAEATVRFSIGAPLELDVRLLAGPQRVRPGDSVGLRVNGQALETHPVGPGPQTYRWRVPPGALVAGLNEIAIIGPEPESPLAIGTGTDPRPLGLGVTAFVLERRVK